MKWIYLLLCSICLSTIANAQQNKQQRPPERTTDPAKTQTVKEDLPVKKSDNGKAAVNTSTAMPIRKSDMAGSATHSTAANNKTTTESTKQQTPSASGVPKKEGTTPAKNP